MARFRSVERVSEKSRMTTRRKVSSQTRASPGPRSSLNPTIPLSSTHAGSLGLATSLPHAPQSLKAARSRTTISRFNKTRHYQKIPYLPLPKETQGPSRPKLPNPQPPGANPESQQQPQPCPNPTNAKRTTSPILFSSPPQYSLLSSPPLPNPH